MTKSPIFINLYYLVVSLSVRRITQKLVSQLGQRKNKLDSGIDPDLFPPILFHVHIENYGFCEATEVQAPVGTDVKLSPLAPCGLV